MIPASAPPRVAAHLRSVRDAPAPVLHSGPDALYLDVAGRCVGVVGTRATAVPCALRSGQASLPAVERASVRGGVLHLGDEPVVVGRLLDVSAPRLRLSSTPGTRGRLDVSVLIGRGDGLTPYGDDVVCGWLAVHRAAGVPTPEVDAEVRALSPTTTLLSATLLDCAMHGEVIPEFAAWLSAIGTAEESRREAALVAVGHSSGRGLLEGARRALGDPGGLGHLGHLDGLGDSAA